MSNSEKPVISIPLDLPQIRVLATERTAEGNFIITVETTLEGTVCPQCGQFTAEFHGFEEWLQGRPLPILERKVYIGLRPNRYRCPACGGRPTTTQKLAWREENSPNTKAYEDYILKRLINSTVEDVSRKEEIGYDAVEGVIERRVAKQVDWARAIALKSVS